MIEKAVLTSENDTIKIGVPFVKVDEQRRIVSGFATLDNIDKHGDIVTAEASEKAFSSFRGNVREQHLPIAAGRVVNFRQQEFYDPDTERMYSGVFVDAYVSTGAQDTWEKVLDGTLSGFSIGGSITKANSQYVPDLEKTIRFITEYDLIELSLVDSPANHLANVFSITKADGVVKADGIATETTVENVFWCETDSMAIATKDDSASCSACNTPMASAGWFETVKNENRAEKMRGVLEASGKLQKIDTPKGGSEVADKETKETVEETKEVKTEEVKAENENGKAEKASEVTEPDFSNLNKALGEIKDLVEKYNQNNEDRDSVLKSVRETVDGFEKTVDDKFTELLEKHNSLANSFTEFKDGIEKIEKRLDGVEAGSAVKKSHDADSNNLTKSNNNNSSWSGAFLPNLSDLDR